MRFVQRAVENVPQPQGRGTLEKRMPTYLILTAALIALAPGARAAAPSKVTALEVAAEGGKLIIHADVAPDYTVFKLSAPPRVVIDLNGADVSAAARPLTVHKGGIAGISAAQFDEGGARVGRIVVALEGDQKYDVSPYGNDLVLTVGEAPAAAPQPAAAVDPNVVLSREDAIKTRHPAHKLSRLSVSGKEVARVRITTDGEVEKFGLIELKNPGRLALDLHGISGKSANSDGAGPVKGVRVAKREDGLRVVIDADGEAMPKYEVSRRRDGLEVRVGEQKVVTAPAAKPTATATATATPTANATPIAAKSADENSNPNANPNANDVRKTTLVAKPAAPAETVIPRLVPVRAVDLRTVDGRTEVLVALEDSVRFEISRPDPTTSVLLLHGASLADRLERKLDASSLGGTVQILSSYRVPDSQGDVKVVATVAKGTIDEMTAQKGTLIWKFRGPRAMAQAVTHAPKAAAMASESKAAIGTQNVYDASQYTGRKVDFNVKDIDIRNLLGAIAEISKKNIIVADDVRGSVTIKLRNVPWDQALDIILKSKGLGREDIGNIIRVAPIQTLRAEAREAAEANKNRLSTEPLKVRLIPVNYAKAVELTGQLKDALTDRGTVSVDARTNTLIVKDVQEALLRAEGIVRNLDTQTPEVLIESRIVEAATSFSRQAGIQWGGNVSFAPTFGNPTGLIFPNILSVAGAADDSLASSAGLLGVTQPNFAVNMPTAVGANTGGGLGFVFGSAGGAANLNLRLTAAEASGTIKTISSPRVVTVDNVDASISQGVSIPFSQTSAAGVSTTFVEARLELRVTPHVTQEGSIQMKINATNNQPNPQLTGANGQPSISRREAKTEVLVKDGETTVIGGIYTRRNSEAWNEVPILSKIPVLGWLFKKKAVQDDRTELLIFITPRIVNRSQSVVATAPGAGDESKQ
jgi:type IV pilus assembly protein PilQ